MWSFHSTATTGLIAWEVAERLTIAELGRKATPHEVFNFMRSLGEEVAAPGAI